MTKPRDNVTQLVAFAIILLAIPLAVNVPSVHADVGVGAKPIEGASVIFDGK